MDGIRDFGVEDGSICHASIPSVTSIGAIILRNAASAPGDNADGLDQSTNGAALIRDQLRRGYIDENIVDMEPDSADSKCSMV